MRAPTPPTTPESADRRGGCSRCASFVVPASPRRRCSASWNAAATRRRPPARRCDDVLTPGTSTTRRWRRPSRRATGVRDTVARASQPTSRRRASPREAHHRSTRRSERHRGGIRAGRRAAAVGSHRRDGTLAISGPRMRVAGALQRRGFSSSLVARVMRGIDLTRQDQGMEYTHLGRSGLSVSRLSAWGPHELRSRDRRGAADRTGSWMPRWMPCTQLLRHRRRLRLEAGRGSHRADRRPVVRAGRRTPGQGRDRDQAVRLDERLAQRHVPVRPQHPTRLRRVVAPAADRPPGPLPDAPRRPAPRRSTRSGRRWRCSSSRRKDRGRRFVELCRLDNRSGAGGGTSSPLPRARQRAVPVQPRRAPRRGGGDPGSAALRGRHHRLEPADARPARRHPRQAARRRALGVRPRPRSCSPGIATRWPSATRRTSAPDAR